MIQKKTKTKGLVLYISPILKKPLIQLKKYHIETDNVN